MWIPANLIYHRILGKDRIEPCKCGHHHRGKEVILPEVTSIEYMDMLVAMSKYENKLPFKEDMTTIGRRFISELSKNVRTE